MDPLDVPTEVLDFLAEQVEVADASAVKGYLERRSTRFEHQAEIAAAYWYRELSGVQQELARSIDHQAWLTGDGPKALFDAAVLWLRERRVLLPGVTTLARLVAQVRDAALQRLRETVAGLVTAEQARLLADLLEVPEGKRVSELERLRRGPCLGHGAGGSVGAHHGVGRARGGRGGSECGSTAAGCGAGPVWPDGQSAGVAPARVHAEAGHPAEHGGDVGGPGHR